MPTIEPYLLSIGWKRDDDGGLINPDGNRRVSFETDRDGKVYGWALDGRCDHDDENGATWHWMNLDEGDGLGELKLALAGLETQKQGAL